MVGLSIAYVDDDHQDHQPNEAELLAQREDAEFEALQPPMPEHLLAKWRAGATAYARFQREFHRNGAGALTLAAKAALLDAAEQLKPLAAYTLGDQREFMLLGRLQDVYVPLAREAEYCVEAASWSLQRALNPLGTNSFAVDEGSDGTLWNAAVSGAIGYYRRAGDSARAEAALKVARKHPSAATRYDRLDQTPLIYHPGVPGYPWWDPRGFSVVRKLEAAFADPITRADIEAELDGLIESNALQPILSPAAPLGKAGGAAGAGAPTAEDGRVGTLSSCDAAEGRGGGEGGASAADGVMSGGKTEGSWSEFPLFDGRDWADEACALLPTLCKLMRGDGGRSVEPSVCTAPPQLSAPNLCGTSIVVTVLRLAPGAAVLPHCGITNRRLTMQFALRGSDGVEFTVGGETRGYGGDGKAIVFDDSFEHSVIHRGEAVRYVLYAVLKHPNVTSDAYG
jgi:hypothetical protein